MVANETYLATHEYCSGGKTANCNDPAYTHGHFGPDFSSTWNQTPDYQSLDSDISNTAVNITRGRDNLNLFTHYFDPSPASKFVVADHPISVLSDYNSAEDIFFHSGSIGLGSSSTLMKQLLDYGRINRNVVGMYLGTAYPRAGGIQNGSVVLGGYDSGRLDGAVHKYPLDPLPPNGLSELKVHIKQMSLVTSDSSSIGLVTDSGFDAHISTTQYAMDLPQSITTKLASALKASPADDTENVLQLAQKFNGNLTITLEDGFEIVYSADWISNISNRTPFSKPPATTNTTINIQPLVFGTAFLHHLYLTIDYEDRNFYLANAKMSNSYVQPQSLCVGSIPQAMTPPPMSKFVQTGMIGAVIGGLFAGVGATWLCLFCVRRALRKRTAKQQEASLESGKTEPVSGSLRMPSKFGSFGLKKTHTIPAAVSKDGKTMSDSSSDSSSITIITADTKSAKVVGLRVKEIELDDLAPKQYLQTVEKPKGSPVPPLTPPAPKLTIHKSPENNLPNPNHFENPYARSIMPDTPYNVATPGTANPLLGGFYKQYSNFDDADDSDLYPRPQDSEQQVQQTSVLKTLRLDSIQEKPGPKMNVPISTAPLRRISQIGSEGGRSRPKPVPLPLKVKHLPQPTTEEVIMSMSPSSMRSTHSKRHSILRKVFPAS